MEIKCIKWKAILFNDNHSQFIKSSKNVQKWYCLSSTINSEFHFNNCIRSICVAVHRCKWILSAHTMNKVNYVSIRLF